jgi:hypothetical protein
MLGLSYLGEVRQWRLAEPISVMAAFSSESLPRT